MTAGRVDVLTLSRIRGRVNKRADGSIPNVVLSIDGQRIKEIRPIFYLDQPNPGFKFRIGASLAKYVKGVKSLRFSVDGEPIPVVSSDIPTRNSAKPVGELVNLLENGHFISKKGQVLRSLRDDLAWQEESFKFYKEAREKFLSLFGYDLYVTYGTLLGLVRQGDFIPGDDDFDTAYQSKLSDVTEVRAEFLRIVSTLLQNGEDVRVVRGNLIQWKGKGGQKIDVFVSWIDQDDYYLTFAVGGPHAHLLRDGYEEIEFKGRTVLAPVRREELLEAIYGPNWRTPDPLFQWVVQPAARQKMRQIRISRQNLTVEHWTRFYQGKTTPPMPSPFAQFAATQIPASIRRVVDLGCGNARDTLAVAGGRKVLGVDYSPSAIEHNRRLNSDLVSFARADVSKVRSLTRALSQFLSVEPVAVYSRFFIHAIDIHAESVLLRFLKRNLLPGSMLLLEFRTDKDAQTKKEFGEHYRRFVDPKAFAQRIKSGGYFSVVYERQGHGMAVYKDEDPHVARMIIKRRGPLMRTAYRAMEKLLGR